MLGRESAGGSIADGKAVVRRRLGRTGCPRVGALYARLLGWQVFGEKKGWATVAPSEDAGYNLAFQTEKHYLRPVWPTEEGKPQMSMHLDIEVDDLEQAVVYAVSVGAQVAAYQPQDTVRVMLDPAGHPFCLYIDTSDST